MPDREAASLIARKTTHKDTQRPPEGEFIIRQSETGSNRYSIVLRYIVARRTAKSTVGIVVSKSQWDARRQQVKLHAQKDEYNSILTNYKGKFDRIVLAEFKKRQSISIEQIREILSKGHGLDESEYDLITIAQEDIEASYSQKRIRYTTYAGAKASLKMFKDFLSENYGADMALPELVNSDLIKAYIEWRQARGNSNETINTALKPIMQGVKLMRLRNIIDAQTEDSILKMYLPKTQLSLSADAGDSDIKYLTPTQFNALLEYRNSAKYERTKDYIDMFAFSAYACGLRWSDIVSLQWKNIDFESRILSKVIVKSNRRHPHTIRLSEKACDILSRWQRRTGGKRFVFGLLPDKADIDDQEYIRRMTQSKGRSVQTSLSTIAQKLEFKQGLTFHMARHSFAVAALSKSKAPCDISRISKMLAHSTPELTSRIYARFIPQFSEQPYLEDLFG